MNANPSFQDIGKSVWDFEMHLRTRNIFTSLSWTLVSLGLWILSFPALTLANTKAFEQDKVRYIRQYAKTLRPALPRDDLFVKKRSAGKAQPATQSDAGQTDSRPNSAPPPPSPTPENN